MRICYIGDGGSVHNHFMVEWFVKRGHAVLFLTDTPEKAPACEVRAVAPRHGRSWRHLSAAWRVRRAIREWKPDVVHAHNVTGYGYWGALCGFHPLFLTAWGSDLYLLAKKNLLVRLVVGHTLRQADLITADARDLCRAARELGGGKQEIRLWQWGVNLAQWDLPFPAERREQIRQGADWVFISTRRLRPIYNIDVILRAFAETAARHPSCRLIVVGEDELSESLRGLARELGIAEAVTFTGWVEQDALQDFMRSADVFISVPSSDSTALSLLEAFAARNTIITADLEANREWIVNQKNGLLVPPGNVEALRDAMTWTREHREEIASWRAFNRRLVEERGDREAEMARLEAWYYEWVTREMAGEFTMHPPQRLL